MFLGAPSQAVLPGSSAPQGMGPSQAAPALDQVHSTQGVVPRAMPGQRVGLQDGARAPGTVDLPTALRQSGLQ